jgi:hypothetical protein
MMKYFKLLIALCAFVLALGLASLVGCSPKQQTTVPSNGEQSAQATDSVDEEQPTFSSDPFAGLKPGDLINLGTVSFMPYWDPSGRYSEDISWRVLAVEEGRALVISERVVELRPFGTALPAIWETSEIRTWLNGEFYTGLPQDIQSKIIKSNIVNSNNATYDTSGGNDTQDYIFLLSIDEASSYFADDADRQTGVSVSGNVQKAVNDEFIVNKSMLAGNGGWMWWLRSPGGKDFFVAFIGTEGTITDYGGRLIAQGDVGIRPAMWIEL